MKLEQLLSLAEEAGFDHAGELNVSALNFRSEVRDMCKSGRCGAYGTCWTCPPACGTLEAISQKASAYHRGILLQSTGILEDDFDIETMMDTEQLQKERFLKLVSVIRETYPDCLPMGSGTCTQCKTCTYPDAPCRFPHLQIPSMESYGLVVSDTCAASGMKYYYGPKTITYTACILID